MSIRYTFTDSDGDTVELHYRGLIEFGNANAVNLPPVELRKLAEACLRLAEEIDADRPIQVGDIVEIKHSPHSGEFEVLAIRGHLVAMWHVEEQIMGTSALENLKHADDEVTS